MTERLRSILVMVLKWSAVGAVLWFVGYRAVQLLESEDLSSFSLAHGWLAAAILCYGLGYLPAAAFWRRLVTVAGPGMPWSTCLSAYYWSQLGKYAPGKAMLLAIRGHVVARAGGRATLAIVATVYENLFVMGVGTAIAVYFLERPVARMLQTVAPPLARAWETPFLRGTVLTLGVLCSLPIIAKILVATAEKITHRMELLSDSRDRVPRLDIGDLLTGIAFGSLMWLAFGLSLLLTIRAVAPINLTFSNLLLMTQLSATSIVAGFLALFAPAGIGIREGVLLESLRTVTAVPAYAAVAAPVLFRLVALAAESIASIAIWIVIRRRCPRTARRTIR